MDELMEEWKDKRIDWRQEGLNINGWQTDDWINEWLDGRMEK